MTLKDRIKILAQERGISLPALESELGFGNSTIVKWDRSTPNADKLNAVAKYFGVTMDYLLNGENLGWIQHDEASSRKEAPDDKAVKLAQNIQKFHGSQKALNENYEQLSDRNKKKVVNYSDTLLKIQKMEEEQESLMPQAAHERTDTTVTAEMIKHDDDIMDDPNF